MFIRKFYDVDSPENGGGWKVLGSMSDEDLVESRAAAAEAEAEAEEPEGAAQETPPEATEVKAEEPAQVEKEDVAQVVEKVVDWREEAKNNKTELYTLLGIDEKEIEFAKKVNQDEFFKKAFIHREEKGTLQDFIEKAGRDWDRVSSEQLALEQIKEKYAHLSPEKQEKLAKADFKSMYAYVENDLLTEEENAENAELAALRMESAAEAIRKQRKEEQKNYIDSIKPVDRTAEMQRAEQEQLESAKQELEQFKVMIAADPSFAKLNSDKALTFGEGESKIKQLANPEAIMSQTLDTNKFFAKFWKDKVFDFEKWSKVVAYSDNMTAIENGLFEHGKSNATKKLEDKLENKTQQTANTSSAKKSAGTVAQALAKGTPMSLEDFLR